ncbi:hypothetical protein GDO78_016303 [Eleutherodactylus coqui]|uniref:Ig-like domain-containing protein n=1 Tax=Eleutherodactylus coqui TaxID=57060 RepID=A0A8J6BMY1_ELECQ|nr:hypothetical protein GDO78_016303 [Eleutherodactylus coqui]
MESVAALLLLLGVFGYCQGLELFEVCSGSNVTFTAEASARPLEINWFNGSSKIVEVEEGKDPFYYTCQGRCIVNLPERTIIVKNVIPADSGTYRAAVLVGGTLQDTNFGLRVDDPVCNVTIRNKTVQNNVTLQCVCSSSGAAPAKYEWYKWDSRNDHLVSDKWSITVHKEEKPQLYKCVAFNGACYSSATFTVPPKEPEPTSRVHIYVLIAILILALIIIGVILLLKKTNILGAQRPKSEDEECKKLTHGKSEESLTPCVRLDFHLIKENASKIDFKKAESHLMKIVSHQPSLCLEKMSVQRGTLKIMDVKEEDYATYTAKVHPPIQNCETFTFRPSELAQNGGAGAHGDQSERDELVYPVDGELKMQILNAKNAEEITWRKDDDKILTLTCSPDPLLDRLELSRGALRMDLIPGDLGPYCAEVSLSDGSSDQYKFDINVNRKGRETDLTLKISEPSKGKGAALGFDVTFLSVNVREAEKITWKKDDKTLVEWDTTTKDPKYLIQNKVSLDCVSGNLTVKNVEEKDKGKYILVAKGDRTTTEEFSLSVKIQLSDRSALE